MPNFYHLKLDIKFIMLANFIDQGSDEKVFIRYHIPVFGSRSIQVDTKEIQSKKNLLCNECASFECRVSSDQIEQLELRHITFELRSRKTRQFFGGIMERSRLLGGEKISWKDVMGSKGMELEKWVNFSAKGGKSDALKLPNLLVETKVQVMRDVHSNEKKRRSSNENDLFGSEIDIYCVETLVD
jgi:hypothetical protein